MGTTPFRRYHNTLFHVPSIDIRLIHRANACSVSKQEPCRQGDRRPPPYLEKQRGGKTLHELFRKRKNGLKLPYIHRFSMGPKSADSLHVALFTEVFLPILNGVVFAVDGLCRELWITSISVTIITPKMTGQNTIPYAYADKIRDLPSFPLPGNSGYRGLWPISAAAVGRHIGRIDLVHAHSFFLCGLLARRVARKQRLPFVLTYHTLLEAYSHYAGFASSLVRLWLRAHTRAFANSADVVTVPTAATAMMLRAVGVTIPDCRHSQRHRCSGNRCRTLRRCVCRAITLALRR